MDERQDTTIESLLEHPIEHGPNDIATVFARAFELAMQIERERFLGVGLYERSAGRQGYANLPLTALASVVVEHRPQTVPKAELFRSPPLSVAHNRVTRSDQMVSGSASPTQRKVAIGFAHP